MLPTSEAPEPRAALQHTEVQHSTAQYSTVQHSTVQHSTSTLPAGGLESVFGVLAGDAHSHHVPLRGRGRVLPKSMGATGVPAPALILPLPLPLPLAPSCALTWPGPYPCFYPCPCLCPCLGGGCGGHLAAPAVEVAPKGRPKQPPDLCSGDQRKGRKEGGGERRREVHELRLISPPFYAPLLAPAHFVTSHLSHVTEAGW